MTFDKNAYRVTVLKKLLPAQKAELPTAIRLLQETGDLAALGTVDVAGLLAVTPDITDIASHLTQLKQSVLNKRAEASLIAMLLKVLEEKGFDLGDPAWWNGLRAAKAEAFKDKIVKFAKALALECQALEVVTEEHLAERAQALPGVDVHELRKAVEKNGIVVRAAIEPPTVPVPEAFREVLKFVEFRSIVDVLLLGEKPAADVKVIDELSYADGRSIGAAQITAAYKKSESTAGTDAVLRAQKVLTLIKNDYTGLDRVDAARIIAYLTESNSSVRGLGEITNMLASGNLAEARRLLGAINADQYDPAELASVTTSVDAAEKKKEHLVGEYQAAIARHDYTAAETALVQAARIDTGDQRLTTWLKHLPPPAPGALSVKVVASGGVRLTWQFSGGDDCRFTVVRADGHAPVNPNDGTMLGTVAPRTFDDAKAPVGRKAHYSVFAVRDGVVSAPVSAEVVVVPAPGDVTAVAGLTEATVSWRLPAEAVGVRCSMIDGSGNSRELDCGGASQVTVNRLVTGQRYRFTVEAMYVLADGGRVYSAPATASATPRGSIAPVEKMNLTEGRLSNGRNGIIASWSTVGGFPVELWSVPIDEKLPAVGSEVAVDGFDDVGGRKLQGVARESAGTSALEFAALSDIRWIVPLTVDGERAVIGAPQVTGSAQAPTDTHADRFGDELVVSWKLPHGDYAASVTWTVGGVPQHVVVTRADYRRDGGFRIPSASTVRDLAVATVAFGNGQEWRSATVPITFDIPKPVVDYQLVIPPSRFGKRKPARLTVRAAAGVGPISLIVVIRTGSIMPTRVEHDDIQVPVVVDFSGAPTAEKEFDIPKLPSPFWVRIFPAAGSDFILRDPPTDSLKG